MFGLKLIKKKNFKGMNRRIENQYDSIKELSGRITDLELQLNASLGVSSSLSAEIDELKRKKENGRFVAKVKMFEPFKIRVTPNQSKRVQEVLFAEGESWRGKSTVVENLQHPFLYFSANGLTFGEAINEVLHNSYNATEITYRQFLRIYSPKRQAV